MKEQTLRHAPLKGISGFLLILGLVLGITLLGRLATFAARFVTPFVASLTAWLIAGVVAVFVARRYILEYRYTADSRVLRVERLYGRHARFVMDAPFRLVEKWGTLEEIRAAYPKTPIKRAILPEQTVEPLALAVRTDEGTKILVVQPDGGMRAHILSRLTAER